MNHQEYLDEQREYTKNKINSGKITSQGRIQNLIKFSKNHISGFSNPEILCVGCRNGYEIVALNNHGFTKVRGIDLYSNNKKVQIMDMHELEFDNDTFDVVFACHSLEHGNNPQKYLSEIVRVLKDKSILVLEVPILFKNNKKDENGNIVFDLAPRFPGDVDHIDFESCEVFTDQVEVFCKTDILNKDIRITKRQKPKAQGIMKLVLKINKEATK